MTDEIYAYKVSHPSNLHSKLGMINPHYHAGYEVYIFLGDKMQYFLEDRIYSLKKNDIVIVDTFKYHKTQYLTSKDPTRINLSFELSGLALIKDKEIHSEIIDFLKTAKYIDSSLYKSSTLLNSLDQLISICDNDTFNERICFRKKAILLDILLQLMDISQDNVNEKDNLPEQDDISVKISNIIKYINHSFSKDISLYDIAEKYNISRYYLCRIFKKYTGMGIVDFVNNKRLIEAEKLLKNTDYSISKISKLTGFNSMTYFSRLFKKIYKRSPGQFKDTNV